MKSKSKRVQKTVGPAQSLPVSTTESNAAGDKLALLVLFGLLAIAAGTMIAGIIYGIHGISAATQPPIDWTKLVISLLVAVASAFAARSIAGLSLFGAVMLASKQGAWKSLEQISSKSLGYKRVLPGGTAWLSTALVQSLVNRGQYTQASEIAQSEWNQCGDNEKQKQGLGTLCFAAGVAKQGEGDMKQSQLWNERAIATLEKSLEELKQPPKGVMARLASTQSSQFEGQIKVQLAAAYFNSATMYFNAMDHRRAKENYKRAVENAVKAPDFPQKQDIVKFANDQLARLKHT